MPIQRLAQGIIPFIVHISVCVCMFVCVGVCLCVYVNESDPNYIFVCVIKKLKGNLLSFSSQLEHRARCLHPMQDFLKQIFTTIWSVRLFYVRTTDSSYR